MSSIRVLLLLLLTSCASYQRPWADRSLHYSAPELVAYYLEFLREAEIRGVPVDTSPIYLGWASLESPSVGRCYTYWLPPYSVVLIDRKYWESAPGRYREELVYHELGHCLLGLGHTTAPGIMHTSLGSMLDYPARRVYYLDMLFYPQQHDTNIHGD